jgi:hypothetical protein
MPQHHQVAEHTAAWSPRGVSVPPRNTSSFRRTTRSSGQAVRCTAPWRPARRRPRPREDRWHGPGCGTVGCRRPRRRGGRSAGTPGRLRVLAVHGRSHRADAAPPVHPRSAGVVPRARGRRRAPDRPARRPARLPRRPAVASRVRIQRAAPDDRLGRAPHRLGVGRADVPAQSRAVRRRRQRLGHERVHVHRAAAARASAGPAPGSAPGRRAANRRPHRRRAGRVARPRRTHHDRGLGGTPKSTAPAPRPSAAS